MLLARKINEASANTFISESLSLDQLAGLIKKVNLVIGSDTGPTHLAWALNTPSITLFGSTPGYRNAFTTKINRIIESKSVINPYRIDKNDYSINDISVGEIVKNATKLLNE